MSHLSTVQTLSRRIAELEAENDALRANGMKLVRENTRYWDALTSIEANTCCARCREAALVARSALCASDEHPQGRDHGLGAKPASAAALAETPNSSPIGEE